MDMLAFVSLLKYVQLQELLDYPTLVLLNKSAYQIIYKFSFYPRTITIWNNLPITDDVNLNNFKSIVLADIKL